MGRNLSLTSAVLWIATAAQGAAAPTTVTFAKDVAPILFQQCASCHRPGGAAPFSVLTFAEARPRAKSIAAAVQRRTMPPWKPEPGYGEFVAGRRLTDEQIAGVHHAMGQADRGEFATDAELKEIFGRSL